MRQEINEEIAKKYSGFTSDNDLKPDVFYLPQDISNSDTIKMDRLQELKNKSFNTEAEKEEMAQLVEDLKDCMITSDDWAGLACALYTLQIFTRDEIVVFIKDRQEEFYNMIDEFKFVGIWNNTTLYKRGNMVVYNGYGFSSRSDNNIRHTPNVNLQMDDYWVKYTLKGDKGEPSLNIFCRGFYDPNYTYNLSTGDACIYDGLLYYVLSEGVKGVLPTDATKWKVVDLCVASTSAPSNTNVIWFNTSNSTFNKYSNGSWVSSTLDGKTAKGILGTNEKVDLADAITEVNTKIINTQTDIQNVIIKQNNFTEDSNGRLLYKGKNVGVTTASELPITTIAGLSATNVQQMGQQLFTYANNGKTAIASVVGNVNSGSTFIQIQSEIQNDKNILANKLSSKGVSASGTEILSSLCNKVGNITIEGMGGIKTISGVSYCTISDFGTNGYSGADGIIDISSQCPFQPKFFIGYATSTTNGNQLAMIVYDINNGYATYPTYVSSGSSGSYQIANNIRNITNINKSSILIQTASTLAYRRAYFAPNSTVSVRWTAIG